MGREKTPSRCKVEGALLEGLLHLAVGADAGVSDGACWDACMHAGAVANFKGPTNQLVGRRTQQAPTRTERT